jgi:hypothetical protein
MPLKRNTRSWVPLPQFGEWRYEVFAYRDIAGVGGVLDHLKKTNCRNREALCACHAECGLKSRPTDKRYRPCHARPENDEGLCKMSHQKAPLAGVRI